MYFTTALTAIVAAAGLATAAPVDSRSYTIDSAAGLGFPNPNPDQLLKIQQIADGKLSNAPAPPKLSDGTKLALTLIAVNEQFEYAYFQSLIYNVTNNLPGYTFHSKEKKDEFLVIMNKVLAQEALHAINAVNGLKKQNVTLIPQPCKYQFPTTDKVGAIKLAEKFTALVLGTLQDAAQIMAKGGDDGSVRGVTASLGNEGEQEGFYRTLLGRAPSSAPFLTTSVAAYAWSALNTLFIVPGSCPFDIKSVPLPIFPPLSVLTGDAGSMVDARDQTLTFSADLTGVDAAKPYLNGNGNGLFVTYLNGQTLPISEPIANVKWNGNIATFEAFLPYSANIMDGFTVAALTTAKDFPNAPAMVDKTLAAPGLIEVTDWTNPHDHM